MFGSAVPAAVVDVVEVNGQNMRQRMVSDRLALLRSGRARADPSYFGGLKKEYLAALTGNHLVKANDSDEEIPECLKKAVAAARHTQRRFRKLGPLTHWLDTRSLCIPQAGVVMIVDVLVETHVAGDARLGLFNRTFNFDRKTM